MPGIKQQWPYGTEYWICLLISPYVWITCSSITVQESSTHPEPLQLNSERKEEKDEKDEKAHSSSKSHAVRRNPFVNGSLIGKGANIAVHPSFQHAHYELISVLVTNAPQNSIIVGNCRYTSTIPTSCGPDGSEYCTLPTIPLPVSLLYNQYRSITNQSCDLNIPVHIPEE